MKRLKYYILPIIFFSMAYLPTAFAVSTTTPSTARVKEVALTFDDGPYGTSTELVLDILHRENVPATFFLIGQNVVKYQSLTKEIIANGNLIGDHTYDHPKNLLAMPLIDQLMELSKTDSAIVTATGVHTKFFRPPYGNINQSLRNMLNTEGYTVAMWNVDPKDWNDASSTSQQIVDRVLGHLKTHMVIVLHDGRDTQLNYPRDNMVNALSTIIEDLKARGYTFVTADKLTVSHLGGK